MVVSAISPVMANCARNASRVGTSSGNRADDGVSGKMPLSGFTRDPISGIDWFIWTSVMRQMASLSELKTSWSLPDLMAFHDALPEADRQYCEVKEK